MRKFWMNSSPVKQTRYFVKKNARGSLFVKIIHFFQYTEDNTVYFVQELLCIPEIRRLMSEVLG